MKIGDLEPAQLEVLLHNVENKLTEIIDAQYNLIDLRYQGYCFSLPQREFCVTYSSSNRHQEDEFFGVPFEDLLKPMDQIKQEAMEERAREREAVNAKKRELAQKKEKKDRETYERLKKRFDAID